MRWLSTRDSLRKYPYIHSLLKTTLCASGDAVAPRSCLVRKITLSADPRLSCSASLREPKQNGPSGGGRGGGKVFAPRYSLPLTLLCGDSALGEHAHRIPVHSCSLLLPQIKKPHSLRSRRQDAKIITTKRSRGRGCPVASPCLDQPSQCLASLRLGVSPKRRVDDAVEAVMKVAARRATACRWHTSLRRALGEHPPPPYHSHQIR